MWPIQCYNHTMSNNRDAATETQLGGLRVALTLLVPPAVAMLAGLLTGLVIDVSTLSGQAATAVLLTGIGVSAWLLGLRWYGMRGMGMRGGRPLYSSIGFAVLGWSAFLILRFIFPEIRGFGPPGSGQAFLYLLLFEAFAVQIWTFGLFFHAAADWRGPLTAAIASGILFGITATLLFQEAFVPTLAATLQFVMWGVLYGVIRLRTGSLLGTILVQALQSFTAWVVMVPLTPFNDTQMQYLYLTAAAAYAIIIWRLWPKSTEDYRV